MEIKNTYIVFLLTTFPMKWKLSTFVLCFPLLEVTFSMKWILSTFSIRFIFIKVTMPAVEVLAKATPMIVSHISTTTDPLMDMATSQDLLLGTATPPAGRRESHTMFTDPDRSLVTTLGPLWIILKIIF